MLRCSQRVSYTAWKGWAHNPSGGDFLWRLYSTSPLIFLPGKIPLPLAKLGLRRAELPDS